MNMNANQHLTKRAAVAILDNILIFISPLLYPRIPYKCHNNHESFCRQGRSYTKYFVSSFFSQNNGTLILHSTPLETYRITSIAEIKEVSLLFP